MLRHCLPRSSDAAMARFELETLTSVSNAEKVLLESFLARERIIVLGVVVLTVLRELFAGKIHVACVPRFEVPLDGRRGAPRRARQLWRRE